MEDKLMDKKYQQVQCWQLDLYGHLNVGVHPAEGHQLDGDDLPRHDTETGEGHPLQEEEAPHPEDAPDQGRGPLPRGGDTAGQARVHHVEDFFCVCLTFRRLQILITVKVASFQFDFLCILYLVYFENELQQSLRIFMNHQFCGV